MVNGKTKSSGDADNNSSPSTQEVDEELSATEKSKFQNLTVEKQRRENFIIHGFRVLSAAAVAIVVISGAFFFFSSGDANEDVETKKEPTETIPLLDCDEDEKLNQDIDPACALRAEFQEKYRTLTVEFLPTLEAASSEEFVENAFSEIQNLETAAIRAFDRSDFRAAVVSIDEALTASKQLKNAITENFQTFFQNAQIAFTNNDPDTARLWIERALRLNTEDPKSEILFKRISVLPEVLTLYQKAAEAEVQNQLLNQYEYLERIIALDPARQDVATRMSALGEQIKQNRYTEFLRQTTRSIENDDLDEARASVNKANAIYPGRSDTLELIRQINELEKAKRVAAMLANAKEYEGQDNWPGAARQYNSVLTEDSGNLQAISGRDKAQKIISANNRAVDMLNQQIRMQDAAVHQRIVEFVDQIRPLSRDSAILSNTVYTLEQTLALWLQEKKVTVLSDGKSMVKVRRVGIVGIIRSKDIQLKPGNYEFECSRKGYRSKIIQHFVPPDNSATSVKIVCDVPI